MITPLKNWQSLKRGYLHGQRTFYSSKHLGTDYIVSKRTPIFASADCEIIVAGKFFQGGNTIWVKFTDSLLGVLVMRCLHLDSLPSKGKYKTGAVLTFSGNTGALTTAPHCHIDLSQNDVNLKDFNNFIDPEVYFGGIIKAEEESKKLAIEAIERGSINILAEKKKEEENKLFLASVEGRFIMDMDRSNQVYYVIGGKRYPISSGDTIQSFSRKFATSYRTSDIERVPL